MAAEPVCLKASAFEVAQVWLDSFNSALCANDASRLGGLFRPDGHWRDLLALTWTIVTVSGRPAATEELLTAAARAGAHRFEINLKRSPPRDVHRRRGP